MSTVFFGITTRTWHYDRTLGRSEFSGSGFRGSMDFAMSPNGVMYVVNRCWESRPDGVRVTILTFDEDYVGEFGRFGQGDGNLHWPTSIALDSQQNVYVSDDWLNRISIFDKDGDYLDKWGTPGSGDSEINKPSGLRFDKDDNLYMVDSANNRVQVFTKDGKFLSKWGEPGTGDGQFNLPWGLNFDKDGNVYVADWRNDRIQKFTHDGKYLAQFGTSGSEAGQLNRPTGVAVDKYGDIYVADWFNNRVPVFTQDGKHITTFQGQSTMSKWGQDKLNSNPDMIKMRQLIRDFTPESTFWRPKQIMIDDAGHIIILDSNRSRIQVYQKDNYS